MITLYIGIVLDRLNGNKIVYRSWPRADYYTAHMAAEKHAVSDRYSVSVEVKHV